MANGHGADVVCDCGKPGYSYNTAARGRRTRKKCVDCWNTERRAGYDPEASRRYLLKNRYGITADEFDRMLATQGGCAICGRVEPTGKAWHIDHDHKCCDTRARSCGSCVRAILCHGCNTALGGVNDDIEILKKMIAYLEAHGG